MAILNQFITSLFLDPTAETSDKKITTIDSQIVEWQSSLQDPTLLAVATYSQVVLKGG
eukprot:CAMPEP_0195305544 /NCGR_PEP_ID=MMETSP0707-20130614/36461_1 /TAXON_ID=33640 /ORGANISM="Asterionellopsis glacialis, Strain CCMP134" /LENGTH=57 /DNA_ID=CAMNT_0040369691 /DNA_START=46 /DNA_END=215 /DNA_ORIENTATION=+